MSRKKKAIVLLSGGMDSATVAAIALKKNYDVHALSFIYGQKHAEELKRAKLTAKALGIKDHRTAEIDLGVFGGSALTDNIAVPKGRSHSAIGKGIPITYVPARNTIFLSFALAFAETINAFDIFIGVNAVDYSGYPDCRPDYIKAYEKLANLATKAGVEKSGKFKIHTPLIKMSKADIIKTGQKLGVNYANTLSCYDPVRGKACGRCDACQLRLKGFAALKKSDPAAYINK